MNTLPPLPCAAANTEVPCYRALLEKGYAVELPGLVGLVAARGAAWAGDADIDAFLHKYGA